MSEFFGSLGFDGIGSDCEFMELDDGSPEVLVDAVQQLRKSAEAGHRACVQAGIFTMPEDVMLRAAPE